MDKTTLVGTKRKYDTYRHHAWAGLGFLSVLLAILYFFPSIPKQFFLPTLIIFVILIMYILVALLLTYRYRKGLLMRQETIQVHPLVELEKEKLKTEIEKAHLKVEKKKAKAAAKAHKKRKHQ